MQLNVLMIFLTFSLLCLLSFFIAMCCGSSALSPSQTVHAVFLDSSSVAHQILFTVRLPRAICAFTTGGLLALAGALMQTLLRNPLADPYILGTSSGAAVMILVFSLMGLHAWLPTASWIGSLCAIAVVFLFTRQSHQWQTDHFILIGIGLTGFFSAILSLLLLISPDPLLRSVFFWLIGDLSTATIPFKSLYFLGFSMLLCFYFSKQLNILNQGEQHAITLGVSVLSLKIFLFLLCSLLTATAVSLAGCIGFIGLIIPHLLRHIIGYNHKILLPGCVLFGGCFLMLMDTLARTLFSPQEIPVGIIMALVGTPLFLYLLQKK